MACVRHEIDDGDRLFLEGFKDNLPVPDRQHSFDETFTTFEASLEM